MWRAMVNKYRDNRVCGVLVFFLFFFIAGHAYAQFGERAVAKLKQHKNKVHVKAGNGISWSDVRNNMKLYENDRLRTMIESSAIASYNMKTNILIKENSLIVIKKMISMDRLTKAEIELTSGKVTGRVESNPDEDVVMTITADSSGDAATVTIDSRETSDKVSDVDVSIDLNRDINVHVTTGKAKVTAKGKTVELGENESTVIEPGSAPLSPWKGNKRPSNMVLIICVIFFVVFVIVGGMFVFMNREA